MGERDAPEAGSGLFGPEYDLYVVRARGRRGVKPGMVKSAPDGGLCGLDAAGAPGL